MSRVQKLKEIIPDVPEIGNGKASVRKPDPAGDLLASMEDEFRKCLPEVLPWDTFARVALTGFRKTPNLVECHRPSLLGALMECARLGLAPCTEQAHLVPFLNRREERLECQLIIGYEGYIQLMYRSGQIEQVVAEIVYENDEWEYTLGDGGRFWHRPNIAVSPEERGKALFAYSYATLVGGGRTRVATVPRWEAEQLAAKYGGANRPWRTHFEAMWLKTPLRRIQRFAPKSAELRRAYAVDGTTLDMGGVVATVEDSPSEGVTGEVMEDTPADVPTDEGQGLVDVEVVDPPGGGR